MKSVNESDIARVERHLAAALEQERRDAVTYTILTVLCTPAFVALAALVVTFVVAFVMGYVFGRFHYRFESEVLAFYTVVSMFLGYMLVFVLVNSSDMYGEFAFHPMWLAGACVFVVLLVLTYLTPLPEATPVLFGVGYAVAGVVVLGLIGQVELPRRITDGTGGYDDVYALLLAVSSFIVAAYGEIFRGSWLWVPPKPFEVRVGARVLGRLVDDPTDPLHPSAVEGRVATLLGKLRLVQTADEGLVISPKGLDFVRTATQSPSRAQPQSGGANHDRT